CWPMLSPRNLATTRATVSVPPPGSKPTTMVTGLEGNDCDQQTEDNSNATSETTALICLLLAPFEDGLPFFHEGLAAFLVILAVEALLRPGFRLGGIVVDAAELADDALRGAHGERRVGGDRVGVFLHGRFKIFFCRYFIYEPHFQGFRGGELPRGDHDLARIGAADHLHQVLHRRGAVAEAHLRRRDAEAR